MLLLLTLNEVKLSSSVWIAVALKVFAKARDIYPKMKKSWALNDLQQKFEPEAAL